jgi:hypothetical protein
MNDVTFVEASRALAERVMREVDGAPSDRLAHAFRLTLSRAPRPKELAVLVSGWDAQHVRFANDPAAAAELLKQGEFPDAPQFDRAELAAYTLLAGVILNLDETITKE